MLFITVVLVDSHFKSESSKDLRNFTKKKKFDNY